MSLDYEAKHTLAFSDGQQELGAWSVVFYQIDTLCKVLTYKYLLFRDWYLVLGAGYTKAA